MSALPGPDDVLSFWLKAGKKAWFEKSTAFDEACRARFEAAHLAAARGELHEWEETAEGALALVLLLDQFPRNIYRGTAHAFATDPLARAMASHAVANGFDHTCDPALQMFFYLPFEHAEDAGDQELGVELFEAAGDAELTKWAKRHAAIIDRFGRFPHRNACLGRATTPEEQAFLDGGGFTG